jgi:hypothetical protein
LWKIGKLAPAFHDPGREECPRRPDVKRVTRESDHLGVRDNPVRHVECRRDDEIAEGPAPDFGGACERIARLPADAHFQRDGFG